MKKQNKKMQLSSETIRQIGQQGIVVGGFTTANTDWWTFTCTNACGTTEVC